MITHDKMSFCEKKSTNTSTVLNNSSVEETTKYKFVKVIIVTVIGLV